MMIWGWKGVDTGWQGGQLVQVLLLLLLPFGVSLARVVAAAGAGAEGLTAHSLGASRGLLPLAAVAHADGRGDERWEG